MTHGVGPYRHMPADIAVQGLAQVWVALVFSSQALFRLLLAGAVGAAVLALRPHRGGRLA